MTWHNAIACVKMRVQAITTQVKYKVNNRFKKNKNKMRPSVRGMVQTPCRSRDAHCFPTRTPLFCTLCGGHAARQPLSVMYARQLSSLSLGLLCTMVVGLAVPGVGCDACSAIFQCSAAGRPSRDVWQANVKFVAQGVSHVILYVLFCLPSRWKV